MLLHNDQNITGAMCKNVCFQKRKVAIPGENFRASIIIQIVRFSLTILFRDTVRSGFIQSLDFTEDGGKQMIQNSRFCIL